jgi:hypothetical protein
VTARRLLDARRGGQMKKTIFGFVIALAAAAGCSKSKDQVLKEFEGFRDEMCKCTTADCANKVLADWRKWRENQPAPTAEEKDQIKPIDRQFHDCEHKVGGGNP